MMGIPRPALAAVPALTALVLAGAAATAAATASAAAAGAPAHRPAAAAPGQLVTYGYDNARDGHDTREPSFAHLKAAWSDGDNVISGGIYGEPLVDGKLVIVATENDKVYGLSAATGKVAWSYTVGTPARLSTIDSAPTLNSSCGDIDPLGITGTPVIDPVHSELYVAAEVQTGSTTSPTWPGIEHVMVALKFTATSVSLAWQHQIDPPGAGTTYYIPAEQQRSALTLANGHVYAEYGGLNGDCGSYQGYVVAMAASGTGALESWEVPTVREGAIWATDGAATGPGGELFVATGNSNNDSGAFDYGDAIIGLSPSLKIDGYFAPSDWAQRNVDDLDLGSGGPTLLPGSTLLFETGKHAVDGTSAGYLMLRSKLGGVGHPAFRGTVCPGSVNVYGANAAESIKVSGQERHYLFVPCPGGTVALRVTYGAKPSFRRVWAAHGPNGTPIIAGGLVWALATDADFGSGPEDLYGMSPVTGKVRVKEAVRPVEHFATPGAGDGMIYVASQIGVQAFKPAG
jgi:hypothetical protein